MFEFGYDQAAGLRAAPTAQPAVVMPVAATSRPGQAYELLCTIASQLSALGRTVVIVDASAQESGEYHSPDGSHFGLVHALQDPSVSGVGAAGPGAEWLVMPGALGLKALQQTAQAGGSGVALSRMLAPFAAGTVVLLYAPATSLSALLAGSEVAIIVPVLAMSQATIDAYGSIKVLHAVGLTPVLAPMDVAGESAQAPLAQVVRSVCDCAQRYLNYPVEQWALSAVGLQVQDAAVAAPAMPGAGIAHAQAPSADVARLLSATVNPTRWS